MPIYEVKHEDGKMYYLIDRTPDKARAHVAHVIGAVARNLGEPKEVNSLLTLSRSGISITHAPLEWMVIFGMQSWLGSSDNWTLTSAVIAPISKVMFKERQHNESNPN